MKQDELFAVLQQFDTSQLSRLEWEQDGTRLVLEKAAASPCPAPAALSAAAAVPAAQAPSLPAAAPEDTLGVKAPLVGVFYAAPSPEASSFVQEGQRVKKGQVLCLIEAMKLMNELPCPADGILKRVLVENGDVVSFGQVLFEVVPC